MNSSQQIRFGALLTYASFFFNMLAGLLYTPWIVRQIGKSDYGLYALVGWFLTYFMMDFGLGQAIARFVARYRAEGDETRINDLLGLTSRIYLIMSLAIFLALVVVFFFLEDIFAKLSSEEIEKFKTVYCIAGFFSVLSFPFTPLTGVLIAHERFVFMKVCDLLQKVGFAIFVGIALLMGYGLYALVSITAGLGLLVTIAKFIYVSRTTSISVHFWYKNRALFRELLTFSAWIAVMGIAQRLLVNIAPTILGIVSGTVQIAILSVGMVIEGYAWTFSNALSGLFLPRLSEISLRGESSSEFISLMIRIGRIQLFSFGLLFVGLMSLGKEFITLWMGLDFQPSYYVLLLLVSPGLVTVAQELGVTLMFVVNQVKYRALLLVGASMVSVMLALILAPRLGAIGSAIGICASYILFHIVGTNLVYLKVMKLNIGRFFRECYGTMLLPFGLSLVVGLLIRTCVPTHDLIDLFFKAILLGGVYVASMWIMGMNSYEKEMIRAVTRRIGRTMITG